MKTMAVGELKSCFSKILEEVRHGEKVGISYGKSKKTIAIIVPYREQRKAERKIGILDGKTRIEFRDDFEMTAEELVTMK
ncbi:MAG: prevent-host-death protein [Spirochaetales bacterium]|jgi:antitoxin (DNA-binding transcriptional repressor) of toxin-antitoxin stability system|nr:prevent-host-death protein [Spirochaetales bacterium]